MSGTRSSKRNRGNGAAIIPKQTAATKPLLASPKYPKNVFNNYPELIGGKKLMIPVVMLSASEIPLHRVHQGTLDSTKRQEIKPTNDQHQEELKPIEMLPPKRRGRKCPTDAQNEKLQLSNRSTELILKNEKKIEASIEEVEPLAKRTRRSLELRECEKLPAKKDSVQTQKKKKDVVPKKPVQPRKNKK